MHNCYNDNAIFNRLIVLLIYTYRVVLPVIGVSEKDVVEPECRVDSWYFDPVLSLLPVQPPEVNTFFFSGSENNLKPVGHKL